MDTESLKCITFGFCEYTWKHTFSWIHFIKSLSKGKSRKVFHPLVRLTFGCVSGQNILVLLKKISFAELNSKYKRKRV